MSLFSPNALAAQQQQFAGQVLLTISARALLWPCVVAGIVVLLIVGALFVPVSRAITAPGVLVPAAGKYSLSPLRAGAISKQFVAVGSRVREGDPLVVVSADVASSVEAATLASVAARAKERITSLEATAARDSQLADLGREELLAKLELQRHLLRRLDLQLKDSAARVTLREQGLARYKGLEGFFSDAQIEQQIEALLQQQESHSTLQRQRDEAQGQIADTERSLASYPLRQLQAGAAMARELASVRAELAEIEARREVVIRAPAGGFVATVNVAVGQPVQPDTVILTLLPDRNELVAEIELPDHAVGHVRSGAQTLLRVEAFPYERYGELEARLGKVSAEPRVTRAPAVAAPNRMPTFVGLAHLSRQTVDVGGEQRNLLSGMKFTAVIRSDRRRIWQWLLEPLLRERIA